MKYTKYLVHIIKTKGLPNFNEAQFRTAMNVVNIEGRMEGVRKSKIAIQDNHKLDMTIYREGKKLTEITGNVPERDFWYGLLEN